MSWLVLQGNDSWVRIQLEIYGALVKKQRSESASTYGVARFDTSFVICRHGQRKQIGFARVQDTTDNIDTTISRNGDDSIEGTEIDTDHAHLARVRNLRSSRCFKVPES